jgi:hypothetical protein
MFMAYQIVGSHNNSGMYMPYSGVYELYNFRVNNITKHTVAPHKKRSSLASRATKKYPPSRTISVR